MEEETTSWRHRWVRAGFGVLAVAAIALSVGWWQSNKANKPNVPKATAQVVASGPIVRNVEPETTGIDFTGPVEHIEEIGGAPASFESSSDVEKKPRIHIVKKGEWLSRDICPNDWRAVAKLNELQKPDLIYPGDKIILTDACTAAAMYVKREDAGAQDESFAQPGEEATPVSFEAPVVFTHTDNSNKETVVTRNPKEISADQFLWKHINENRMCGIATDDQLHALMFTKTERERLVAEIESKSGTPTTFETGNIFWRLTERDLSVRWKTGVRRNAVVSWNTTVPGTDGKPMNTALLYTAKLFSEEVEVLVIDRCCNIAVRKRKPPETPKIEAPPPKEEPPPEISQHPCPLGTCVPPRLTQDCATTGCGLSSFSPASPPCAAPCRPPRETNSGPAPSQERIPIDHGETEPLWTPRPKSEEEPPPHQGVEYPFPLCGVNVLATTETDLSKLCAFGQSTCYGGVPICKNP